MAWRNAEHLSSLAGTQVAIEDILKDFEAVDFFHCEPFGLKIGFHLQKDITDQDRMDMI